MNRLKSANVAVWAQDIFVILLGCFVYAISINCFTDPNNISPGGVIGIGQLVGDLTGFPKGLFCLLINIPIFLWAFAELNWRGLIKNLFATVALNVFADLTVPILPEYKGDMMIAAILAGISGGIGLGLIFTRGAATGGTDLLATLTKIHIPHIPVGKILMLIDGTVVGVSTVVYSIGSSDPFAIINGATYAAILLFVEADRRHDVWHEPQYWASDVYYIEEKYRNFAKNNGRYKKRRYCAKREGRIYWQRRRGPDERGKEARGTQNL